VPNEWLRKREKDLFHRLAKQQGYRSRASYKLLQVVRRSRFLKRGDFVLDLGAAPGGWLQAARQVVGERGYVLGVDKESITPFDDENVATIAADITQADILEQIQAKGVGKFDAVISDLSPNVSGVWELDHARQIDLARHTLKIAREVLKPSGNMLVKVFQGSELKEFQLELKASFRIFRIVKPPASRSESAELYLLGMGFVGQ
jgi:23S rRNA (uridine2552-2'-O)-methyltransferase